MSDALKKVNSVKVDIHRLVYAKYGSYLEIAYEWTYTEAEDMLELLEISEEFQHRQELKASKG